MDRSLLDTNVLVHAVYEESPLYDAALTLLERGLRDGGRYCVAPQNLVEFAALCTRPRFVKPPLSPEEAARKAGILFRSRRLAKIYPRRATVLRALDLGRSLGVTGSAWYDLFLATTMQEAGVRVVITEDVADFRKFPFLTARRIQEEV